MGLCVIAALQLDGTYEACVLSAQGDVFDARALIRAVRANGLDHATIDLFDGQHTWTIPDLTSPHLHSSVPTNTDWIMYLHQHYLILHHAPTQQTWYQNWDDPYIPLLEGAVDWEKVA